MRCKTSVCLWGLLFFGITAPALANTSVATTTNAPLLNAPYITGTHYSARELMTTYREEVGQPVTEDRLEAISRRLEDKYRDDGFLVPIVVTQNASGATPHLHVFEARVSSVRVVGDAGVYTRNVNAAAARLRSQPVLHKATTQRTIRDLEDLPGLSVRSDFTPRDGDPNGFELLLDVSYERVDGALAVSNRVADEVGDALLSGRVAFNSLLGTGERLSLSVASSDTFGRYTYAAARAERGFGPLDVELSASMADAHTSPVSWYDAQRYGAEISSAVVRRNGFTVRPLAGLSARNARDEDEVNDPWSITRTRAAHAGVEITDRRARSASRLRLIAQHGLDVWDARTFRRDGDAADVEFVKAALEVTHTRVLVPGWQLRAGLEGQYSADEVPAGERFAYGGSQFGRAFDAGSLIADSGASASLQLDHYRNFGMPWLNQGRAFVQADYALGRDNDGPARTERGASLSAGLALRSQSLTTTVEAGYALEGGNGVDPQGKKLRVFVGSQYAF